MFLSVLITVASLLTLSKFTVHSAPVVRCPCRMSSKSPHSRGRQTARDVVNQFCTGINGTGTCTPLDGELCTNTAGIGSLILGTGVDCIAYVLSTCESEVGQITVLDQFSNLTGLGIQSVECSVNLGNLNEVGLPLDQAQKAAAVGNKCGEGFGDLNATSYEEWEWNMYLWHNYLVHQFKYPYIHSLFGGDCTISPMLELKGQLKLSTLHIIQGAHYTLILNNFVLVAKTSIR
ncbi:hypothetical protein B0H19DRAFT_1063420 [Mycena capillaripes]|nr:hypothetical protein B0H19DRAFT_1063420 [Mycena capillaripes]